MREETRKKKESKQNSDKSSGNPKKDGFSAEELGEESIYEEETEIAQRIRRENKDKEEGDEADIVGSVERPKTDEELKNRKTRLTTNSG